MQRIRKNENKTDFKITSFKTGLENLIPQKWAASSSSLQEQRMQMGCPKRTIRRWQRFWRSSAG